MRETWKRQVSIAGIGLTLGLVLVLATAAIPSNGTADPIERETSEQRAYDDMVALRARLEGVPNAVSCPVSDSRHTEAHVPRSLRHPAHGVVPRLGDEADPKGYSPYDEDAPILHA